MQEMLSCALLPQIHAVNMARLPRLVIANQHHYVMQQGNNRQAIFLDGEDYQQFLKWLQQAAKIWQVAIHAYALLPDCLHLLLSPADQDGLGRMMQWLGRYYVPYFNRKYQRSGSLWQGRYRATVIEAQDYFLKCSLSIEASPVHAGLALAAVEYPWSSYQHHAGLRVDPLISDDGLYWALGNTPFEREAAYKNLMENGLSQSDANVLAQAAAKAWVLGKADFKAGLEKLTERRLEPKRRGRPRKIPL
jgi:putative transposase